MTRSGQIVQYLSVLSHLISLLTVSSSLDSEELQTHYNTAEIHKEVRCPFYHQYVHLIFICPFGHLYYICLFKQVLQVVHWCMLTNLLPHSLGK